LVLSHHIQTRMSDLTAKLLNSVPRPTCGVAPGSAVCSIQVPDRAGQQTTSLADEAHACPTTVPLSRSPQRLRPTIQMLHGWYPHSWGWGQACIGVAGHQQTRVILSRFFPPLVVADMLGTAARVGVTGKTATGGPAGGAESSSATVTPSSVNFGNVALIPQGPLPRAPKWKIRVGSR
jgi:hypothetical protein